MNHTVRGGAGWETEVPATSLVAPTFSSALSGLSVLHQGLRELQRALGELSETPFGVMPDLGLRAGEELS